MDSLRLPTPASLLASLIAGMDQTAVSGAFLFILARIAQQKALRFAPLVPNAEIIDH